MAVPPPVILTARAKLTLSLRVTGVRSDGYHLIEAEMVSLDLADTILIEPARPGVRISIDGQMSAAAEDDLVVRALAALGSEAGATIDKRIPMGAGLGGGSSDAAAVLRWAGNSDASVAVQLGADVPFCVQGGRALVRGIGEVVDQVPHVEQVFTLATPPLHCSTPVVYRMWDDLGGPGGDHGNDLEPAALAAYPELGRFREAFERDTGRRPRLAGSGSTWFVEGEFPGTGRVIARTTPSAP